MPLYDYKCPSGHINEHFLPSFVESVQCSECEQEATYCPSFYYSSQCAQRFTPVVIHKDAQGNIRYPGNSDAPVPPGFEKVELRDFHQIRKFEKEVNDRESVRAQEHHSNQVKDLETHLARNRDMLVVDEKTGRTIGAMQDLVRNFSPRGKKFYDSMKQVSEQRLREFSSKRPKESNFHIEAFSFDASNREAHNDLNGVRNRK